MPASGECYLSIATSAEEEAEAGEEPVLPERGSPAVTLEDGGEHNGLYGNAFAEAGIKAGGFSDEPPEMSIEALPTTRCKIGALLPASSMSPGGVYDISSNEMVFVVSTGRYRWEPVPGFRI